jgi:hypothetical protein
MPRIVRFTEDDERIVNYINKCWDVVELEEQLMPLRIDLLIMTINLGFLGESDLTAILGSADRRASDRGKKIINERKSPYGA